jgi:hypothetical protein
MCGSAEDTSYSTDLPCYNYETVADISQFCQVNSLRELMASFFKKKILNKNYKIGLHQFFSNL